jgi:hypothetical protein
MKRALVLVAVLCAAAARAQVDPPLVLEGPVPDGEGDFFVLPFDVPEGVAEVKAPPRAATCPDRCLRGAGTSSSARRGS